MRPKFTRSSCVGWLAVVAVLSACGNDGTATDRFAKGHVRFVNLISDPAKQPVDAFLDDQPFGSAMPFGASSPSSLLPPFAGIYSLELTGDHSLLLRKSSEPDVVVGLYTFALEVEEYRTVYATGSGGFVLRETLDDNSAPAPGTIRLRFVNLSETSGTLDLFITAQDADLTNATPVTTGVSMLASSAYFSILPGTWHVRAVRAGVMPDARSANVVVSLTGQQWDGGGRSIVIADAFVGQPVMTPRGVVLIDQ